MGLPVKYAWLYSEPGPKMLKEALKLYGVLETAGGENTPSIMVWAQETGVRSWYTHDSIAWCGLYIGVIAKRAGYPFSASKLLKARNWLSWGRIVPPNMAMLGDVLVFWRGSLKGDAGHVCMYIGESKDKYLVLGGNQADSVCLAWIEKKRLLGVRRPIYKIGQPANVRKIYLSDTGAIVSKNEA